MPNYNDLVFTGADWKLFLTIPGALGGTYPLKTTDSIDFNTSVEEEQIFFVGEEDAGANKKNGRKRTGKLSVQYGEISSMLLLEGLADATHISGATLGAVAIRGGAKKTWKGVNINTENLGIKARDKSTPVSMDFTALDAA